ncbi:hypothetical protein HDU67_009975 [Dinochytrium kinnereticum]|nr:hypothetical protein HDU67_009975 [Dinochytrium kinnereticum]
MPSSVDITLQASGDDASSIESTPSNRLSSIAQADVGDSMTPQFDDVPLSPYPNTNTSSDTAATSSSRRPSSAESNKDKKSDGDGEGVANRVSNLNAEFVSAANAMAAAASTTTAQLTAQITTALTAAANTTAERMRKASIPNLLDPLKRRNSAPVQPTTEMGSCSSLESLDEVPETPVTAVNSTATSNMSLQSLPLAPSPPMFKELTPVPEPKDEPMQTESSQPTFQEIPLNAALHSSAASSTLPRSITAASTSYGPHSPPFTSSVRHSPHSTDLGMRSLAQQLVAPVSILKESGSLSPWDAADLLTNADALIHLAPKDRVFSKDVLRVGAAFLDSAIASPEGSIAREMAVRDAVDFFAVLLTLWNTSNYRARKFVKTLLGGWYKKGLTMEQLANSIPDDRWWTALRRKSAGAVLSTPKPAVAPAAR